MNLVWITYLVRKAARQIDLEYASRSGEPIIFKRDTDVTEEVRVGGLQSAGSEPRFTLTGRFTLAREASNLEARGKSDATHDDSAPRTKRSTG